MQRKIVHLLILPVLLAAMISGCLHTEARAGQTESRGGITILKTDIGGNPLPGAVFQVAREASWSELTDPGIKKELLKLEDRHITVVYESFLIGKGLSSVRVTEAVTGEDGTVVLGDLPAGTCYLVETKAPEGYRKMEKPVRISVHKYSHLTKNDGVRDDTGDLIDNTIHIINLRYTIPQTGENNNSVLYGALAAGAFSLAALCLLLSFKAQNKE